MKWTGLAVGVVAVAALWVVVDASRRGPDNSVDRGMAGIEFVVPPGYHRLDLDESTLSQAAQALLDALDTAPRVAAVFTSNGDRVYVLVDVDAAMVDENVLGRHGVLQRGVWPGPVRERLSWAAEHNSLAAPGMDPVQRRNAYH